MRTIGILLLIMLFTGTTGNITPLIAQWHFSMTYDHEYNDNPFRVPERQNSWISTVDFGIEKAFKRFAIGYYGNYSHFNSIMERNFYWNQLALWSASSNTSWGLYGEQRINKDDYNIYDYFNASSYLQHQLLLKGLKLTWNGSINFNRYEELSELNNWKLKSGIQTHKSFPTRTTIMVGLNLHHKIYSNSSGESFVIAESSLLDPIISPQGSNYGNGHGRGRKGYLSQKTYTQLENPSVSQVTFWLRFAQSITLTTGLAVQYQQRQLLAGSDRFVSGLAYSYSQESQLFDDPMSHEGYSIGSELTQLLPFNITLKLAGYYTTKNYSAQGIFLNAQDYEELILRKDVNISAGASLKKDIGINCSGDAGIVLFFHYQWLDNESNSYWYDYKNNATSIGIEFEF